MHIESVRIKNFRCFEDLTVRFDKLTIIVGENSIGKSALITAIEKVLGVGRTIFEETDFFKKSEQDDPKSSLPIEIEVTLIPSNDAADFSKEENASFAYDFELCDGGKPKLVVRAQHVYVPEDQEYKTEVRFMKEGEAHGYFTSRHKQTVCFYLVQSIRNIGSEVFGRRGLLSRLLQSVELTAATSTRIGDLSKDMEAVISSDPAVRQIKRDLKEWLSEIMPLHEEDGAVTLRPVPIDSEEVFRGSSLSLRMAGQAMPHPVSAQGSGTQSLLVLGLFDAYVKALQLTAPILGIEEPEAHLHPHAQRSVLRYFVSSEGQAILTTHSTFMTHRVDPYCVRVLRREADHIIARRIPRTLDGVRFLSDKEERRLLRTLGAEGSEVLFSRTAILVEGPSETIAYPIFARACGADFDKAGVSVVRYEGDDFGVFGKVLGQQALEIPYLVQPDGEKATIVKAARRLVALGRADRALVDRLRDDLPTLINEVLRPNDIYPLWDETTSRGFCFETYMLSLPNGVQLYSDAIATVHGEDTLEAWWSHQPSKDSINDVDKLKAFLSSQNPCKPALAQIVAEAYTRQNAQNPVPSLFKIVIDKAIARAS